MIHENYARVEPHSGSSNRSFGVVFAAVFAVIGVLPLLSQGALRLWALAVAGAFLAAAIVVPTILGPLSRQWANFGLLLHAVVSPMILGVMYFLVITPTGLLMRVLGKDPLRLRRDRPADSYWIERRPPGPHPETFRNQF
jgi:hypothetical protein